MIQSLTTGNAKLMKTMLTIILIESLDFKYRPGSYLALRIWAKEWLCKKGTFGFRGGTIAKFAKKWGSMALFAPPVPTFKVKDFVLSSYSLLRTLCKAKRHQEAGTFCATVRGRGRIAMRRETGHPTRLWSVWCCSSNALLICRFFAT